MQPLRIALLQLLSYKTDQNKNLQKGETYCRKAKSLGADIILFPEMWNIGYTSFSPDTERYDFDAKDSTYSSAITEWQNQAIDQQSEFVTHFKNLAKELNVAIVITYLEKYSPAPRNSASLINRHGEIILTYAKVHTCDFSTEAACTPGDDFYVADLDTVKGFVKTGIMICYDREFPESARILMLKGAEIILTPNACDMGDNRVYQFRARAFENMVGVALANYAHPQQDGHSCAFDCIAFDYNGGSRDTTIVHANQEEGIFFADFDLQDLREWRKCETWGNAYRKPSCYKLLTSDEVDNPFIRKDSRR